MTMEIKRKDNKDEPVEIQNVSVGSVFRIVPSITNSLYLRSHDGIVNITGGYIYQGLTQCRTDKCAQVIKATLTVEG